MDWDPTLYERFQEERKRPLLDLLQRFPDGTVRSILDLGCGTGDGLAQLAGRWPEAHPVGVDLSSEMVTEARSRHPGLRFIEADISVWEPETAPDRILCNAVLHWSMDPVAMTLRWADRLAPGGVMAIQVPDNFDSPGHQAVAELRDSPEWRDRLAGVRTSRPYPLKTAVAALRDHGHEVEHWTTTYGHTLASHGALVDWLRGTTLRPILERLGLEDGLRFLSLLQMRIRDAYPLTPDGVPYSFRRRFLLVTNPR